MPTGNQPQCTIAGCLQDAVPTGLAKRRDVGVCEEPAAALPVTFPRNSSQDDPVAVTVTRSLIRRQQELIKFLGGEETVY